jgi:hypothetical protein
MTLKVQPVQQCVIDLDAQVPDGALQLRVPKQQLHGAQVAGLSIDLCCLGSPHRVGAVVGRIKPNAFYSAVHDAYVLTGGRT